MGTGPKLRESFEWLRLSPMTNTCKGGTHNASVAARMRIPRYKGLLQGHLVDIDRSIVDLYSFTRQANNTLDQQILTMIGQPQDDDIKSLGSMETIRYLFDDQALIGIEVRLHTLTIHPGRLADEHIDEHGDNDCRKHSLQYLTSKTQDPLAWRTPLCGNPILLWGVVQLFSHTPKSYAGLETRPRVHGVPGPREPWHSSIISGRAWVGADLSTPIPRRENPWIALRHENPRSCPYDPARGLPEPSSLRALPGARAGSCPRKPRYR